MKVVFTCGGSAGHVNPALAVAQVFQQKHPDCEVLFISYDHIIHPCTHACLKHTQLINNLFALTAEKLQTLELRINILAQKNMRQKLLTYLEYAGSGAKGEKFVINMTITELAAYLNVDRSSLMREMKRMKEEGLIWSEGRKFRLLSAKLS